MQLAMSNRVAVVTGSNKGIGLATVRALCKRYDGDVYLTSRYAIFTSSMQTKGGGGEGGSVFPVAIEQTKTYYVKLLKLSSHYGT